MLLIQLSKNDYKSRTLSGLYAAVILADSKTTLPKIRQEYANVVAKIKPENKDFDQFISHADSCHHSPGNAGAFFYYFKE